MCWMCSRTPPLLETFSCENSSEVNTSPFPSLSVTPQSASAEEPIFADPLSALSRDALTSSRCVKKFIAARTSVAPPGPEISKSLKTIMAVALAPVPKLAGPVIGFICAKPVAATPTPTGPAVESAVHRGAPDPRCLPG
jgi:hypothetical protein